MTKRCLRCGEEIERIGDYCGVCADVFEAEDEIACVVEEEMGEEYYEEEMGGKEEEIVLAIHDILREHRMGEMDLEELKERILDELKGV